MTATEAVASLARRTNRVRSAYPRGLCPAG